MVRSLTGRPLVDSISSTYLLLLLAAVEVSLATSRTVKGRGKIVIHFSNHDEFDRLRAHLSHGTQPISQAG